MKLSPRDAERYFAAPDPKRAGLLIYGADAMRVALKRQQVLAALLGPGAEEEMRLTRLQGPDLRKDPAALTDAVKAVGFFAGARAVFVEQAQDMIAPAVEAALEDWRDGDAQIVVTAGSLRKGSALRKLFETRQDCLAAAIYDDPPSAEETRRLLTGAGIAEPGREEMARLMQLAGDLGPGDFARFIDKLGLYKYGDSTPLTLADIDACAPVSTEAALDDLLNAVAESRSGEIGTLVRRLQAQGTNPTALCIGATRHFRTLYTMAADPGGPSQGIGRLRPPVFGPRRDTLLRQSRHWTAAKLETALEALTDTDLTLRSAGQAAPAMALVERTLIRLAMLAQAR